MIVNILLGIIFFFLGFVDKALSFEWFGAGFYLGFFIYVTLLLFLPRSKSVTVLGFLYFLSLGSGMNILGLLPLAFLIWEIIFFFIIKFIASNKIFLSIFSGFVFALGYLILEMLLTSNFSVFPGVFFPMFIVGLYGGIISIFSKNLKNAR